MNFREAQDHGARVMAAQTGNLTYDQCRVAGDDRSGYHVEARRNDDHTKWERV